MTHIYTDKNTRRALCPPTVLGQPELHISLEKAREMDSLELSFAVDCYQCLRTFLKLEKERMARLEEIVSCEIPFCGRQVPRKEIEYNLFGERVCHQH